MKQFMYGGEKPGDEKCGWYLFRSVFSTCAVDPGLAFRDPNYLIGLNCRIWLCLFAYSHSRVVPLRADNSFTTSYSSLISLSLFNSITTTTYTNPQPWQGTDLPQWGWFKPLFRPPLFELFSCWCRPNNRETWDRMWLRLPFLPINLIFPQKLVSDTGVRRRGKCLPGWPKTKSICPTRRPLIWNVRCERQQNALGPRFSSHSRRGGYGRILQRGSPIVFHLLLLATIYSVSYRFLRFKKACAPSTTILLGLVTFIPGRWTTWTTPLHKGMLLN